MSSELHARWCASVLAGLLGLVVFGAAATLCGPRPASTSLCEWFVWGDRIPPPAAVTLLAPVPVTDAPTAAVHGAIALCGLPRRDGDAECLPVRMIRLGAGGMAVSLQDARTTAAPGDAPLPPCADGTLLIAARITGWFGAGEERVVAQCYLPVPADGPDAVCLAYRIQVAPAGDHLRYRVDLGDLSTEGGQRYNPTDNNWEPLLASIDEVVLTVAAVDGSEGTQYAAATVECDGRPVDLSGVMARDAGWEITGDAQGLCCRATSAGP